MKYTIIILIAGITLFSSCNSSSSKKENTTSMIPTPLKAELEQRKSNFEKKASEHKKKIYAEGIQAVSDAHIVENALQVGDIAPDFSLSNATGNAISLYEELKNGPIILMWYRGGWCPYCNLTLKHMQDELPQFKKLGANLLALTPELPDSALSTQEKNELQFEVLSDLENKVAMEYKVVFKLTKDVHEAYENGFGMSNFNGDDSGQLPLAATYIIGKDKKIKYAFLDADYRNRAEPSDIVEALKKLN